MDDSLRERTEGRARTGFVDLRSFDEGVIETLGAAVDEKLVEYFLKIEEVSTVSFDPPPSSPFHRGVVDPRPGLPGVPVTFASPEEALKKYTIPVILVRREDFSPALERRHPGLKQYRTPARGSLPVQYRSSPEAPVQGGFDRMEQIEQAEPYDISYTIQVAARNRGAPGITNQVGRLIRHVLGVYKANCTVWVRDSVGDLRGYEAFQESTSNLDDVAEVTDRVIGLAVSLRVEGELDLNDPEVRRTVTRAPALRSQGM